MDNTHWEVVLRLVPVSLLGGVVAMVMRLPDYPKIPKGVKRIYMVISTIAVGSCAALVAGLSLPLLPLPLTPETELLIGAVAGSSGLRLFDMYAVKFLGLERLHNCAMDRKDASQEGVQEGVQDNDPPTS